MLDYYTKLFQQYGHDVKSLGWSKPSQLIRHELVTELLPAATASLLDVGCGFADLGWVVKKRFPDLAYTGWELQPDFLTICQTMPFGTFALRDILTDPPANASFDVCLTIGSLNTQLPDNVAIAQHMMARLLAASRDLAIFSATSHYVDPEYRHTDQGMFYYDPAEMFCFAKTLTKKVDLLHSYLPHDFMLIMRK